MNLINYFRFDNGQCFDFDQVLLIGVSWAAIPLLDEEGKVVRTINIKRSLARMILTRNRIVDTQGVIVVKDRSLITLPTNFMDAPIGGRR